MRLSVSIVALVITLPLMSGCAREGTNALSPSGTTSVTAATEAAQPPPGEPSITQEHFELQFLIDSIDQHELMLRMSQMCVAQAVHVELTAYCRDLAAAQLAEQITLRAWLQQWLGVSHPPELGGNDQKILSKLASLNGGDFEQYFLDQMSRQLDAVEHDASQCEAKAFHSELLSYCSAIPSNQSSQLQAWLCQWYSRCRGGGKA
jgi:uncharacterized protein (DUF305 family)